MTSQPEPPAPAPREQPWPVGTVRLHRESRGENDPLARAVVSVRVGDQWIEVIRELAEANFDHYAEIGNWPDPAAVARAEREGR